MARARSPKKSVGRQAAKPYPVELPLLAELELAGPAVPEMGEAERWARARGLQRVAGVDEAGRGPLAGPVVAACVVLDPDRPPPEGIADSKQLTPEQRNELDQLIRAEALAFAVVPVPPERIDRINILQATLEAMSQALDRVEAPVDLVFVDGPIPFACRRPLRCLVKGDQRSLNVAAASILAKVHRDREMIRMDSLYPGYGFARHKGYATEEHRAALRLLGPTTIHRRSFRGVVTV